MKDFVEYVEMITEQAEIELDKLRERREQAKVIMGANCSDEGKRLLDNI